VLPAAALRRRRSRLPAHQIRIAVVGV